MARDGTLTRNRILDAAERLVLERGFAATSVDAVLEAASTTKGGFFHHFPSKTALGRALVERYAAGDLALLEELASEAQAASDDPAEQLVAFLDGFLEAADGHSRDQPGCLYVAFVHERQLVADGTTDIIVHSVLAWRERVREMVEAAAALHPPPDHVDLASLADLVFTTFEGGFILARTMGDPSLLAGQIAHLRTYVELLFGLEPRSRARPTELPAASP